MYYSNSECKNLSKGFQEFYSNQNAGQTLISPIFASTRTWRIHLSRRGMTTGISGVCNQRKKKPTGIWFLRDSFLHNVLLVSPFFLVCRCAYCLRWFRYWLVWIWFFFPFWIGFIFSNWLILLLVFLPKQWRRRSLRFFIPRLIPPLIFIDVSNVYASTSSFLTFGSTHTINVDKFLLRSSAELPLHPLPATLLPFF